MSNNQIPFRGRLPRTSLALGSVSTIKDVYSPEREGAHLDATLGRLEGDREAYEAYVLLMRRGVGPIAFSILFGMMMEPCKAHPWPTAFGPGHPSSCACFGHNVVLRPDMLEPQMGPLTQDERNAMPSIFPAPQ